MSAQKELEKAMAKKRKELAQQDADAKKKIEGMSLEEQQKALKEKKSEEKSEEKKSPELDKITQDPKRFGTVVSQA